MFKIVLASKNKGKIIELSKMLDMSDVEFIPMSEFNISDIEETEHTFVGNALLKASAAYETTGLPAIADDSGLEIDILGGFPGINSARCAGDNATDEEKRNFVLEKLSGYKNREAQFVCTMAFYNAQHHAFFTGFCRGQILEIPRGKSKPGLPYDSIFYVPELGKTFAELSEEEKNLISHRGRAIRKMKDFLETEMLKEIK